MNYKIIKQPILNVLKITIGIIVLGAALYGSVQIYEVQTHALKREEHFNELFALSLLVPRGFDVQQKGAGMIIENEDYQILIIRNIKEEDFIQFAGYKLYDKNAGRIETSREVFDFDSNWENKTDDEFENRIKDLGFRRVIVDSQENLDGKKIYFGDQACYYTLDKENNSLFSEMELFTSTNKHNSVRVCVDSRKDISAEKFTEYRKMTDKIVMSMEDLLPSIERGRKAYEELHGKEEE